MNQPKYNPKVWARVGFRERRGRMVRIVMRVMIESG